MHKEKYMGIDGMGIAWHSQVQAVLSGIKWHIMVWHTLAWVDIDWQQWVHTLLGEHKLAQVKTCCTGWH